MVLPFWTTEQYNPNSKEKEMAIRNIALDMEYEVREETKDVPLCVG